MPTTLEEWQKRLEGQFTQLASARSTSRFPLFALEHGLTKDEINQIGKLLCAHLAEHTWVAPQWLVWVVYATEFGYGYHGDEYWPSFEDRTPFWRERGSRNRLRSWFCKFQSVYKGVTPSGQWAEWFKIIAWPITHAILPRYLQGQLAKALFDFRYSLARLDDLSPSAVGAFLSANAWDGSSRFREFLQQEELVGRIVLALLTDRRVEGDSPIYPPTLQRIVSDLEAVQSSREWLKETRSFVADSFKGAAHSTGGPAQSAGVRSIGRTDSSHEQQSVRPRLMLRPSGLSVFSLVVEIPSFAPIVRINPQLRGFLKAARCKVAGTGGSWMPGGWLLSSFQRRVIKSWPGAGVPILLFEQPNSVLDHLVDSETRLSSGPIWLFRLGSDGLGREVVGRIVRPGGKYVVLSEADLPTDHPNLIACHVDCRGMNAATLSIPAVVSHDIVNKLNQLGVFVARTLRIWPAGLIGRGWDGEGQSEWLTTEAPCFGIVHDHPVSAYVLRVNDGPETLIDAGEAGSPVFVKIAPLPAGQHTLSVDVHRGFHLSMVPSVPPTEGIVTLSVREPEPWVPGTTSFAGLTISVDPQDPSLDTFWEGNVAIGILGPAGHSVTCSMSLETATGRELLSEQIGSFELPLATQEWHKKLAQFLNHERRAWAYIEASSGRFLIKADELGEYSLRLERDTKPIRWICRSSQQVMTVRLIDDTGSEDEAACRLFSLHRPAFSATLNTDALLTGFQVPFPGGLFEATSGSFQDTMVVCTPQIQGGFQGLAIEPDLQELDNSGFQIRDILKLLRSWGDARQAGPLVRMRRILVINRFLNHLYSRLCGSKWAQAEANYLSNSHSEVSLQELQRLVYSVPGFAALLRRDFEKMEADTEDRIIWFAEVCARYQVCSKPGLCEFALQLASRPQHLLTLPAPLLDELFLDIKNNSTVLRGARFLALLAVTKGPNLSGFALPGWKW